MALITVFGFLLVMAVLVTQFLLIISRQLRYRATVESAAPLRPYAYSALEATQAVLAEFREFDEGLFDASQGWGDPLRWANLTHLHATGDEIDRENDRLGGRNFRKEDDIGPTSAVRITDESGRIPLDPEQPALLRALLEQLEVKFDDQEILIDSLADWIDDDGDAYRLDGAEADWYRREGWSRLPPNAPLQTLGELRDIRGWRTAFFDDHLQPTSRFEQLRQAVSIHHRGAVNLNAAPPIVVAALAELLGFLPEDLDARIAGPDRIRGTADDEPLRDLNFLASANLPEGVSVSNTATLLRIQITVTEGPRQFSLETLVATSGAGNPSNNPEVNRPGTGGRPRIRPPNRTPGGQSGNFTILRLVENGHLD